jgi:hypothetical protein
MNDGGGAANFQERGGAPRVGVLQLEAEAREGIAGAASERRRKHDAGKKFDRRRRQHPFKGGDGDVVEGWGRGKSGDVLRGPRRGGPWLPPTGTARAARHG